jgi:hypothetical protein
MTIFGVDSRAVESQHDIPFVGLWYPREEGSAKAIEIELIDVRAADSLQVSYDFDRDGWVVKQARVFEWDGDDEECDPDWQEVAFIKAWARADRSEK